MGLIRYIAGTWKCYDSNIDDLLKASPKEICAREKTPDKEYTFAEDAIWAAYVFRHPVKVIKSLYKR